MDDRLFLIHYDSKEEETYTFKMFNCFVDLLCDTSPDKIKKFLNTLIWGSKNDNFIHILRHHGIWGLPPSLKTLSIIKKIIETYEIDIIIDHGAGTGLWDYILHGYLEKKTRIVAFDIFQPNMNRYTHRQRGYYPIVTELLKTDIENKNALMMFIWPTFNSIHPLRMLEKFKGRIVLVNGHPADTATPEFFNILANKWNLLYVLSPLVLLKDEYGDFKDKILIYERKIDL